MCSSDLICCQCPCPRGETQPPPASAGDPPTLAGVRGTRVDPGRLLQCSSTSAARMGHVRVRDGFHLFPPLPGRVPLWRGDSD